MLVVLAVLVVLVVAVLKGLKILCLMQARTRTRTRGPDTHSTTVDTRTSSVLLAETFLTDLVLRYPIMMVLLRPVLIVMSFRLVVNPRTSLSVRSLMSARGPLLRHPCQRSPSSIGSREHGPRRSRLLSPEVLVPVLMVAVAAAVAAAAVVHGIHVL